MAKVWERISRRFTKLGCVEHPAAAAQWSAAWRVPIDVQSRKRSRYHVPMTTWSSSPLFSSHLSLARGAPLVEEDQTLPCLLSPSRPGSWVGAAPHQDTVKGTLGWFLSIFNDWLIALTPNPGGSILSS